MSDMNFFSDMSLEQKRAKSRLALIIVSLLAVAILMLGLFIGINLYFKAQEQDLARRQAYLDSPEVAQQVEEIDLLQEDIAKLEGSAQALQSLENYLNYSPRIKTVVLDALTSTMPDDVIISSISVSQGSISLSATSEDERSPLVFSAALKENLYFTDVYLSGISRNTQTVEDEAETEQQQTETAEEEPENVDEAETEETETEETEAQDTDTEQETAAGGSYSFNISCSIQMQAAEEGNAQ